MSTVFDRQSLVKYLLRAIAFPGLWLMDYREAGVDVEAGRAFVDKIRNLVHRTYRPEVIGGLGGFSGCFHLPSGYTEPVLVSGTDGVGTKLKLACELNRHDTVGIKSEAEWFASQSGRYCHWFGCFWRSQQWLQFGTENCRKWQF